MILKKSHLILVSALAAALVSCKKDDDTETLPYLDGTLTISGIDSYIKYLPDPEDPDNAEAFFKHTISVSGVTHPEGGTVTYKWKVSPGMDSYETVSEDGTFSWGYKDTLATFTISCQASADGYTSSSSTKYVTMVKFGPDGSIQTAGYPESYTGDNYVEYDGIKYFTFTGADGKTWMQQNLAYKGNDSENPVGHPYVSSEAMSDVFGRYYTWNEAMGLAEGETVPATGNVRGICPEGWHIPRDSEWTGLANGTLSAIYGTDENPWEDFTANEEGSYPSWSRNGIKISKEFMAGELISSAEDDPDYDYGKEAVSATFNTDTKLWTYYTKVGDPTNKSRLSAIPVGYAQKSGSNYNFFGVNEYAVFWTADHIGDFAICREISCESPDVVMNTHDKESFAAAVRCVKD